MNIQEALQRIQRNPQEFFRQAGVNVPAEIVNDPQAVVMHLINTQQIGGNVMQRIMPMIRQMTGK